MGNKNENIQIFILEQLRRRNTPKQNIPQASQHSTEESQQSETIALPMQPFTNIVGKEHVDFLREIKNETEKLQIEKNELTRNKQVLKFRIAQQIETRKHRIEQQKAEIFALKQTCQTLQAVIQTPTNR